MSYPANLSDDDLLRKEAHAHRMAYLAPRVVPGSANFAYDAWAKEWGLLKREVERRGLEPRPWKPTELQEDVHQEGEKG